MNDTEELKNEIASLLCKLGNLSREEDAEAGALYHLNQVATAFDSDPQRVDAEMGRLKDFWLHSVAWCSALSKDIEKILIMYDDLLTSR